MDRGTSTVLDTDSDPVTTDNNPVPETSTSINQKRIDKQLTIGTWNIRRGLITRELALKNLLKFEDIISLNHALEILFLN